MYAFMGDKLANNFFNRTEAEIQLNFRLSPVQDWLTTFSLSDNWNIGVKSNYWHHFIKKKSHYLMGYIPSYVLSHNINGIDYAIKLVFLNKEKYLHLSMIFCTCITFSVNRLPEDVVNGSSVNAFKNRLDGWLKS